MGGVVWKEMCRIARKVPQHQKLGAFTVPKRKSCPPGREKFIPGAEMEGSDSKKWGGKLKVLGPLNRAGARYLLRNTGFTPSKNTCSSF